MTNLPSDGISISDKLQDDEFLNESDGLVYCKICHKPKQKHIEYLNHKMTVHVMCECEIAKSEKEKEEQARKDFQTKVSQMKSAGLQDKALYEYNFDNDSGINPEMKHAHTYVDKWKQMLQNNTGLLLWGDVGTGKSFFAGCIANALIDKCVPVLMTNFTKILNSLTGMFSEDRNHFIESLNIYSLLIIDDLGVERNSEFAMEQVFSVIDSRYRSGKPMIITTNLTLDELKNTTDRAKKRIYDRILERCVPIKINRQNIRDINAAIQLQKAKEMFT